MEAQALEARAASCAHKTSTLLFDCQEPCGRWHPCVIHDTSLVSQCGGAFATSALATCMPVKTSDSTCQYECFKINRSDPIEYDSFTFFIPFGDAEADQQQELLEQPSHDRRPWKSDEFVHYIDRLALPATTTSVAIVGGSDFDSLGYAIAVPAAVTLAPDLFADTPQLTDVTLQAMDLTTFLPTLIATLPPHVRTLNLGNTRITTFPVDLADRPALESLLLSSLQDNSISALPANYTNTHITYLDLQRNIKLEAFDAFFPNLVTLNLAGCGLTEFPMVIFSMSKLKELRLDANNMLAIRTNFTLAQVRFIQQLEVLYLPAVSLLPPACDAARLQGFNVTSGKMWACISDWVDPTQAANVSNAALPSPSQLPHPSPSLSPDPSPPSVSVTAPPNASAFAQDISTSKSTKSPAITATIGGGVAAAVVAALLFVIVLVYRRRMHRARAKETNTNAMIGSAAGTHDSPDMKWLDDDLVPLQVRAEDIEDIRIVGSGGFGVVWLAKYRQARYVASKRLIRDQITPQRIQGFVQEIKLVATLDHPHIVAFIGAAWTMATDLQALFEYMEQGDLRSLLDAPDTPRQWTATKVRLALHVAEALVYVHSFYPPLVHRDLKASNVLLTTQHEEDDGDASDGFLVAKLSDFGVSRFQSEQGTMTTAVGTGKWLAPEVIAGRKNYDQASDVFALGVILSEIDTHLVPYDDARGDEGNRLEQVAILQRVAAGELLPTFNASCPSAILTLAKRCLAFESHERPTAVEIAYSLRKVRAELPPKWNDEDIVE